MRLRFGALRLPCVSLRRRGVVPHLCAPVVAAVPPSSSRPAAGVRATPRDGPEPPARRARRLWPRAVVRGAWARVRCDVRARAHRDLRHLPSRPASTSRCPTAGSPRRTPPDDAIRFDGAPAQPLSLPVGGSVRDPSPRRGPSTDNSAGVRGRVLSPLVARHPFRRGVRCRAHRRQRGGDLTRARVRHAGRARSRSTPTATA